MGLYIHSLSRLSDDLDRDYYIYILDFDFEHSFNHILQDNFRRIADFAARNRAVVMAGTNPRDFAEQVFSAHMDSKQFSHHSINGEDGRDILPAIMITTIHPNKFKDVYSEQRSDLTSGNCDDDLLLIPLRKVCGTGIELVSVIEGILQDIAARKPLSNFEISKRVYSGDRFGAISDAVILKPTVWGIGVDIKQLIASFRKNRGRRASS